MYAVVLHVNWEISYFHFHFNKIPSFFKWFGFSLFFPSFCILLMGTGSQTFLKQLKPRKHVPRWIEKGLFLNIFSHAYANCLAFDSRQKAVRDREHSRAHGDSGMRSQPRNMLIGHLTLRRICSSLIWWMMHRSICLNWIERRQTPDVTAKCLSSRQREY